MDLSFLVIGIYYFLRILTWLIVIRIILSWVAPNSHNPVARFIIDTTEQFLDPIRRMIPRGSGAWAMIDWSPLIALILIDILSYWFISTFG